MAVYVFVCKRLVWHLRCKTNSQPKMPKQWNSGGLQNLCYFWKKQCPSLPHCRLWSCQELYEQFTQFSKCMNDNCRIKAVKWLCLLLSESAFKTHWINTNFNFNQAFSQTTLLALWKFVRRASSDWGKSICKVCGRRTLLETYECSTARSGARWIFAQRTRAHNLYASESITDIAECISAHGFITVQRKNYVNYE